jgi:hypothetical protein
MSTGWMRFGAIGHGGDRLHAAEAIDLIAPASACAATILSAILPWKGGAQVMTRSQPATLAPSAPSYGRRRAAGICPPGT